MTESQLLAQVRRHLRVHTGVDAALLPGSLEDAVHRRLIASGLTAAAWVSRLQEDVDVGRREAGEILVLLGIGHTHLFRHRAVWDVLVQELAGDGLSRPVEILLLGVSTGEEAYTALMQIGSRLGLENVSALGIDINPRSIARAATGEYRASAAEHVPAWAMDRYLEPTEEGFRVCEAVRRRARFLTGSLFDVPVGGRYDLVLMRHVLIYFRPEDRRRALDRAAGLCGSGGLLVLGASEGSELTGDERFEGIREGLPVFRKRAPAGASRGRPPVGRPSPPPGGRTGGRREREPVGGSPSGELDMAMVHALLHPVIEDEDTRSLDLDLSALTGVKKDAAWALGRGLRLLALRGTVVTVLPPAAEEPRGALKGALVWELARNGLIRWDEP